MVPLPAGAVGFYIVAVVVLGMALGLVAGIVFALALGLRVQGLLTDALLGSLGLLTGLVVVHYLKTLEPALLLALIFPLMHQFARLRL
jgi:hypothetical protein